MIHIIQNDPEVPPGNLLDHLLLPYSVHHPYRGDCLPKPEQISALIVMGGAMGANDDHKHPFLTELKELVRTVVAAGTPYLGVCLGGQLLAAAVGAQVVSNRWDELGTMNARLTEEGVRDQLFCGVAETFTTFQWHHDSFDIPAGAVLLASSAACPHQAFRLGTSAWALQFHPEVTEAIVRDWSAWDIATAEKLDLLLAEFSLNLENYGAVSRQLMENFQSILNKAVTATPTSPFTKS
jgi:GMP synthase-like glutamine amidotransferase